MNALAVHFCVHARQAGEIDKTIVCFCTVGDNGGRFKLAAVPVRELQGPGQVAGRGRRLLGMRGGHSQSLSSRSSQFILRPKAASRSARFLSAVSTPLERKKDAGVQCA